MKIQRDLPSGRQNREFGKRRNQQHARETSQLKEQVCFLPIRDEQRRQ